MWHIYSPSNHHYSKKRNISILFIGFLISVDNPVPFCLLIPSTTAQLLICFLLSKISLHSYFYVAKIIKYKIIYLSLVWFLLYKKLTFRFIHTVAFIDSTTHVITHGYRRLMGIEEWNGSIFHAMDIPQFIISLVDRTPHNQFLDITN